MKRSLLFAHLFLFIILAFMAVINPAVGGEGDTIMHYFWAKHVWTDAEALFRSWAKPFFTLFASPWTLFGFKGIKVFNILAGTSASYLASLYALERNWKYFFLVPVIAFIGPAYLSYLNSGLTEPFGALVLMAGVYLIRKNERNTIWLGYLLLSFLPFCRSEAQVLIPLFALYALLNKQYRFIPLLAIGTLVYSIVGSFYRNDLFWVFHSPYVAGASVYGKGNWSHYLERLNLMLSLPVNLVFLLGLVLSFLKSIRKESFRKKDASFLLLAPIIFISAHSTVWALGIYASAGLERVLILIFPLIWLLVVYTLQILLEKAPRGYRIPLLILFITASLYSSFDRPKVWKHYFNQAYQIGPYQNFIRNSIEPYIVDHFPDYRSRQLVSDLPYLSLLTGHNPLNPKEQVNWQRVEKSIFNQMHKNSLFIWDSHNVPFYTSIDEAKLKSISWLDVIQEWEMGGRKYILLETNNRYPYGSN